MRVLDRMFKPRRSLRDAIPQERHLWIGLRTSPWLEEIAARDYKRQPVYLAGSADLLHNINVVGWCAKSDWGDITHFSIFRYYNDSEMDELGSGNLTTPVCSENYWPGGATIQFQLYSLQVSGPCARRIAAINPQ